MTHRKRQTWTHVGREIRGRKIQNVRKKLKKEEKKGEKREGKGRRKREGEEEKKREKKTKTNIRFGDKKCFCRFSIKKNKDEAQRQRKTANQTTPELDDAW